MSVNDVHSAQRLRYIPPTQGQSFLRSGGYKIGEGGLAVVTAGTQPCGEPIRQNQTVQRPGAFVEGNRYTAVSASSQIRPEQSRGIQTLPLATSGCATPQPPMVCYSSNVQGSTVQGSSAYGIQERGITAARHEARPVYPIQNPMHRSGGYDNESHSIAIASSQPAHEQARGLQPCQRRFARFAEERSVVSACPQPNHEQSKSSQSLQGPEVRPQARQEHGRVNQQLGMADSVSQPLQRPMIVGSGAMAVHSQQELPKRVQTLQRPTAGCLLPEDDVVTNQLDDSTAQHEAPRTNPTSLASSGPGDTDLPAPAPDFYGSTPRTDSRALPAHVPRTAAAYTSCRASWPPVKRPGPVRAPAAAAIAPQVRACPGDDDTLGDDLISTVNSISSLTRVDADEKVRRPEFPDRSGGNLIGHMGNPSREPALDRENSNAAAIPCHTSTPKLNKYSRAISPDGLVNFQTVSRPSDCATARTATDQNQNAAEPAEEVSFTWKLLGAADKVAQMFSSLLPNQDESRRFTMRQTLPNPKRLQPSEIFELRQQDQMKEAARRLKDAVQKLIAASGTTNAEMATLRLPVEIRSKFARLRFRLAVAFGRGQQPIDPNVLASNLERLVAMCNYLGAVNSDAQNIDRELRFEFINFSQNHSQDLESHCRTFQWFEEQRQIRGTSNGPGVCLRAKMGL